METRPATRAAALVAAAFILGSAGPGLSRPAPPPAAAIGQVAPAPANFVSRWDWRDLGMVTPPRDMGICDASWCFAAVGAVESLLLIKEGRATDLSEQQILACVAPGRGCHGGWMHEAYRFIRDEGVGAESCYPFNGFPSARCNDPVCPTAAVIADWVDIPNDVAAIKAAVMISPVTTAMFVPEDYYTYDGTYCLGSAPATGSMLGTLIVGWDDALCGGAWICKNSVGTGWGDGGFFKVRYGAYGIGDHAQRPVYSPGTRLRAHLDLLGDVITGNNNGWPEPGETVQLFLSVRNGPFAPARTDLSVSGHLLSGPASAPAATWDCGPLAPGSPADLQPIWPVSIDRFAAPGDTVRLELRYTDAGAPAGGDTVAVAVGRPSVLIVDDDEGEHLESWYVDAVARAGYPLRLWDESRLGPISRQEMRRYRAVVWFTGVLGRLNEDDYGPIAGYLQGGGNLFLTGQDIGWWLNEMGDANSRLFYENVLQSQYLADASGVFRITGAAGDPIGDGLAFGIGGPGGSGRQLYPDLIAPLEGAQSAFFYGPGQTAAVRSTALGKLLYCAFGFEAIDEAAGRDSVMTRVLRWMAGPPPDFRPPRITLLSPRIGERIAAGSTESIHWRGRDDTSILYYVIERSHDGGATWPDRLGFAGAADTTFAWTVGDTLGSAERIRVSGQDRGGLWGEGVSGTFSVVTPPPPDLRPLVLLGAAPNPFNGGTEVRCHLGVPADQLTLTVFDARGRRVRRITTGPQAAGEIALPFDGRDDAGRPLPSGLYGFRVAVPGAESTGRFALVK